MTSTYVFYDSFKKPQIDGVRPNPSNLKFDSGSRGENYTKLYNIPVISPGFKRISSGFTIDPDNSSLFNRCNIGNSSGARFVPGWYVNRRDTVEDPFVSYRFIGGPGRVIGNGLIKLSTGNGYIISLSSHSTSKIPCTIQLYLEDKFGNSQTQTKTLTRRGQALFFDTNTFGPPLDKARIATIKLSVTGSYSGIFRFNNLVIRKKR